MKTLNLADMKLPQYALFNEIRQRREILDAEDTITLKLRLKDIVADYKKYVEKLSASIDNDIKTLEKIEEGKL